MNEESIGLILAVFIPFVGTCLGSLMVFFMKNKMNPKVEKLLIGFAAGVMIAASIWSLIIPAIEQSSNYGAFSFVPAAIGFLFGIGFLLLLDSIMPHLHINSDEPEGIPSKFGKKTMMVLAITIHNIPEGMAVGVVIAGALTQNTGISFAGAIILCLGIAIQNFPEGAIVSMPLKSAGVTKKKSFVMGVLSGAVEPISALITIGLTTIVLPILPYVLSFAAGAMIYVVVEELIPAGQDGGHSNLLTIGVAFGFVLMMILDVALG